MIYAFDQFKTQITDPTVHIEKVVDNIAEKTCSVEVLLSVESASFSITLDGFTYSDTWEDSDIDKWVKTELEKHAEK
jgi:hypothetical protein